MTANPVRIVLASYSFEEGHAKQALQTLKRTEKACLAGTGRSGLNPSCRRYESLRLEGETLLIVETVGTRVDAVVKLLRLEGSPAIFAVNPDFAIDTMEEDALATVTYTGIQNRRSILARLQQNQNALESAGQRLTEATHLGQTLTPAAEWILDNSHLIRTQIVEVRHHLPRDYSWRSGASQERGNVNELAHQLVASAGHVLTEENIRDAIRQYQIALPLTIADLWAFPLFLGIALVELLARLAMRTSSAQQLREAAHLWSNRLAMSARSASGTLENTLRQLEAEPISRQPCFVTSLAEQLQDEETALGPALHWIEERFGTSLIEVVRQQHTDEAAEVVSTANAFTSLRAISRIDFTKIFEEVSLVEAELRRDPSGVYQRSDFATRDLCRRVVERVAQSSRVTEREVAVRAVNLASGAEAPAARYAGYYLLSDGLAQLERDTHAKIPLGTRISRGIYRHPTPFYLGALFLLTACLTALTGVLAWEAGIHGPPVLAVLAILAVFPLSEVSSQIVNALVISMLPPGTLPKMDFREGIPPENATLVVVPMMLSGAAVLRAELEKLEVRFLGNRNQNISYSLFSDFLDADTPTVAGDDELLQAAKSGIANLNLRYPGDRFLLFHRERFWSEGEQKWIGRERKRGKLEDLNSFLCGDGHHEILHVGQLHLPISFVITLDADTQLPVESARRLIETIAHPLNRVEIDAATGIRKSGYSIIQPRVSITLPGATATRFTRVFADATGTDPYSQTVSDAQQDLFLDAIFHGKAIYDVRAFHAILGNRFPVDTLLSHDLIEGAHAGVGLATDIELFEQLPVDYASFAARQHRWTRGDWQIARWALGSVPSASGAYQANPLTLFNRWRILDNLRRSLVPAAALLLLLMGWLLSAAPAVWTLVVGLAVAIPATAPLVERLARRLQGSAHRWQGAADDLIRAVVMAAFLPHQAWISVDAIARVFYRRTVSHRGLLEWQTAAHAKADAQRHTDLMWRQMLTIAALSLLLTILLLLKHEFAPTSIFVLLWAASPLLMRWLARPVVSAARKGLKTADILLLRILARRTWRFFDDLVGPESNWLPPDNTQLALRVEVAQRTSPTNIGLWLTGLLAARDFGYVTADEFCRRGSATMETLGRLERYEGHLLNWYDTQMLQPLLPRYVSTVDSGNLLAALWVLERGCADILEAPVIGLAALRGLNDTLSIVDRACVDDPSATVALYGLRRLLRGSKGGHEWIAHFRMARSPISKLEETQRWHPKKDDERTYWVARLAAEFNSWIETANRYLRWMETLALPPDDTFHTLEDASGVRNLATLRRKAMHAVPSLRSLAGGSVTSVDILLRGLAAAQAQRALLPHMAAWVAQLTTEYAEARSNATETVTRIQALSASATKLAEDINMNFLYDAERKLFGIGYAVGGPREFPSHYDLLASECRVASLVAIARGDVPVQHWHALSRPYSYTTTGQALLSWSGTMFEYLMPLLFTRTFTNSMLECACRDAVAGQIEYGKAQGIPWGVSESAYSALDSHQIYQYKAFGVPALALNPGLEDALVVAPYATVLALLVDPVAALKNLERLQVLGLAGPMGFYESIDFTRENTRHGKPGVVTYSYMAHHQGMTLAALDNVLHRDVMQRRFHGDLRVRSIEALLYERNPITRLPKEGARVRVAPIRSLKDGESVDRMWTEETAAPRVQLLGNGRLAVATTNSGGGYTRWNQFDLTRWRSDPTLDPWGSFLYIRDVRSDEVWATTYKPFSTQQGESSIRFAADRVEMRRRVSGIETVLEVTVSPEDDAELRRLRITNRSVRKRQLEFTSYLELAMAPHGADTAHPAFAKMFIETEYPESGVLIAHRRPRSADESPLWAAHILVGAPDELQYETDRSQFLGRGNNAESPAALTRELSGTVGAVIDPVFSLRCRISLDPRDRKEITFVTLAAATREALLELIHRYQRAGSIARAYDMAWARAQLEFRFLRIGPDAAHRFQELVSQLLYPSSRLRPPVDRLVKNRLGQSFLWAFGISGDLPMLVVTVRDERDLALVRELLLAHAYWRLRGFRADLIIMNQEGASYEQPLRQELLRQIEAHTSDAGMDKPGGVFLRDWNSIPEDGRNLLLAVAGVVLNGNRGSLQQQLTAAGEGVALLPFVPVTEAIEEPSPPLPFLTLSYFNGLGGFTPDGKEYAIYLKPGVTTPAPWINVIANRRFGTLVSESGLGCTWQGNSQMNRLTPWHNDPVSDPQTEVIYLRDEQSGAVWTPTALPAGGKSAYRARHGHGYSVYEHNSHGITQELTVFVPAGEDGTGDPVKICRLRLRNESSRKRKLTATWYNTWVLGSVREDQQLRVLTSRDEETGAVMARQYWNSAYAGQVAFAASVPPAVSWSGDRTRFLGRNGTFSKPDALGLARLDNRTGIGADPAAALQVLLTLEPGAGTEVIFLLGQTGNVESMRALIGRYQEPAMVEAALTATRNWWDTTLGALQVKTPVLSTDFLLNGWLLYQALSCRFWGRSALYQSSGAIGFRDQLQDCLAFLYAAPQLSRQHILAAAARQFPEGDAQHWWHGETGMGVRTRCSDDLLWLPFAVTQYVKVTGDAAILDEPVPFLDGPVLAEAELERMFAPAISVQTESLWVHCRRAIEHACKLGDHGLPLIGTSDWNDGMNLVGAKGKGESVWLGWFLCAVMEGFCDLREPRDGEIQLVREWRQKMASMKLELEQTAWDGEWYLRGFFDNGAPLGSHTNVEARIDSIAQSWAVISGAGDPARTRQAMESAERNLVREKEKLVLLLAPPFDHSEPNPGYIMGYPPGLRENGGQYTHAGIWLAMAWARLHEGGHATRLLQMMNPVELTRTPESVAHYRGEPYVVAADVSLGAGREGQCGWTWYTGSAAWMYRVWVEEVLGFQVRGDHFTVNPVLPPEWPGFELTWHHGATSYEVKVSRGNGDPAVRLDGNEMKDGIIPLIKDGGTRKVEIVLGTQL